MMLRSIKGMIKAKALLIKRREMNAVFFIPKAFTRVFVPVFLSASASSMSFVAAPPKRNNAEIHPIASGRF